MFHFNGKCKALIFHQVRKYALKMNIRDQSVDAWRPGILFLIKDIMPNLESLHFVNDLKKSGLLVIGIDSDIKLYNNNAL